MTKFHRFSEWSDVTHGFLGKPMDYATGAQQSEANRQAALRGLAPIANELVLVRQVHSARVEVANGRDAHELAAVQADALISNEPGRAVGVLTADCVPVLLYAADTGWVGAVHAGRKGALAEIVPKTIAALETFGAARSALRVGIGPYIHAVSYEVGESMYSMLPNEARYRDQDQRFCCDLGALINTQLRKLGIGADQVRNLELDTWGSSDWHSYRRDSDSAGRNLSLIVAPGRS